MTSTAANKQQAQFADHVAGEPYSLTREEFVRFAGLQEDYEAFLDVLQRKAAGGRLPGNGHNYAPEVQAFWAAIASLEAMRKFQQDDGTSFCESGLAMEIEGGAPMDWFYESTSGTRFKVLEWREEQYDRPEDSYTIIELPEPIFSVTIPANRDQPGRSHYEAIRRGGSYRDF
jgi:hypothetical protein